MGFFHKCGTSFGATNQYDSKTNVDVSYRLSWAFSPATIQRPCRERKRFTFSCMSMQIGGLMTVKSVLEAML
jgi:hypothetical protein